MWRAWSLAHAPERRQRAGQLHIGRFYDFHANAIHTPRILQD